MNLEILHRHPGARRIELPRAIHAANAWEVLILDIRTWSSVGGDGGGHVGRAVDGGVAHHALEAVVRVGGAEGGEAVGEPRGTRGLLEEVSVNVWCGYVSGEWGGERDLPGHERGSKGHWM